MSTFRVTTTAQTLADLVSDPSMSKKQFDQAVVAAVERGLLRRSQVKPLLARRKEVQVPRTKFTGPQRL